MLIDEVFVNKALIVGKDWWRFLSPSSHFVPFLLLTVTLISHVCRGEGVIDQPLFVRTRLHAAR